MPMTYLESPSTDPAFNLALEQVVFDLLPRDRGYFMLWQNDNAVIVGRHQDTAREVNASYVESHGIRVVRRLSGGGAVYHDLGNLNFTFVVDAAAGPGVDLALFCTPVAEALSHMGVKAQVTGRNDITVDGRKFSGNAQYVKNGRVMHHGTILFDSDLTVVSRALNVQWDKLASKAVSSVQSRVTNLKPYLPPSVTLADFKAQLLSAMFQGVSMERRPFSPDELRAAESLRKSRYSTWEWNYGASPAGALCRRRRVEGCGAVEAYLSLEKGRIRDVAFRGDYFGAEDASALAPLLRGVPLEREALTRALRGVEASRFFTGLTTDALVDILVG